MRLAEKIALNSAAQLLGQVAVALSGLASLAVSARYLEVSQYGSLLAALAFVSIFSMLVDFGVPPTAAREMARRPDQSDRIASNMLLVGTVMALGSLLVAVGGGGLIYSGEDDRLTRMAIALVAVPLIADPVRCVVQARLIVAQRAYISSIGQVAGRLVSLGGVLAVAVLDLGPVAMAGAYAASSLVQTVVMMALAGVGTLPRVGISVSGARGLFTAAASLGAVLIVGYVYLRLGMFMLSLLADKDEVARYGISARVYEMAIMVPSFVMVTLMPELARAGAGSARADALVANAVAVMQLLALPLLALGLLSGEILGVIAGERYESAAPILALMLVALALLFIRSVFAHALVAYGGQRRLLGPSVAVLATNLALNAALIPSLAAVGAAIAFLLSEAAFLALTLRAYGALGALPRPHMPTRTLAAAGAMAAVLSLKYLFGQPAQAESLALLVTIGLAGLAVYTGALHLLGALPAQLRSVVSASGRRLLRPG